MRSIYRYTITADGQPHDYELCYDPLPMLGLTEVRGMLDFWVEHDPARETYQVRLQIVGTGRTLPDRALWIATAQRNRWGEVAHLVQLPPEGENDEEW